MSSFSQAVKIMTSEYAYKPVFYSLGILLKMSVNLSVFKWGWQYLLILGCAYNRVSPPTIIPVLINEFLLISHMCLTTRKYDTIVLNALCMI